MGHGPDIEGFVTVESPPGQDATQINDLYVDADHTIVTSDRIGGGVYVVSPDDELSARMTAAASPVN